MFVGHQKWGIFTTLFTKEESVELIIIGDLLA